MPLPSTQQYLDIAEVKDDTIILKDGRLRAVLLVSSINFALKSEDEQKAIISGYVSFLNNLDYPLQVLIQSRKLRIDKYLNNLEELTKAQTNELLKMQMQEYINYISELITLGDIMSKKFYVIVPYSYLSDKRRGFFSRLFNLFTPNKVLKLKQERFKRYKEKLDQRANLVLGGLSTIGLSAVRLDTQSLIELFYNTYNQEIAAAQPLADVEKIQVE